MENAVSKEKRPLTEAQKKLFVFLALTVISALVATVAFCRDDETASISWIMLKDILILLTYFAVLYAMPMVTDGYRVLLPILATVLWIVLLICTTPVDMRMIIEARESVFLKAVHFLFAAIGLLFLSLLYMICGALLSRDAKKDGLPPIFHKMSRKAYKILYGILAAVLLVTGVTTSVIYHVQMTELKAYAVSEADYTTVMPNLRVAVDTGEPESVSHGLDRIEYAAIDGVDHHDFIYAKKIQWVLMGVEEGQPMILRAASNTADPAADAPITSITVTGDQTVPVTPALAAQITDIVRGNGTPYKGENEPNTYSVSQNGAYNLVVTVTFEGYDAFAWSAPVVEFEGHYLLAVETKTTFSVEDDVYRDLTYAYFELTELPLPEGEATDN